MKISATTGAQVPSEEGFKILQRIIATLPTICYVRTEGAKELCSTSYQKTLYILVKHKMTIVTTVSSELHVQGLKLSVYEHIRNI